MIFHHLACQKASREINVKNEVCSTTPLGSSTITVAPLTTVIVELTRVHMRHPIFYGDGKLIYMKVAFFICSHLPCLRMSAIVIFQHLLLSGDVELNPGPKEGSSVE